MLSYVSVFYLFLFLTVICRDEPGSKVIPWVPPVWFCIKFVSGDKMDFSFHKVSEGTFSLPLDVQLPKENKDRKQKNNCIINGRGTLSSFQAYLTGHINMTKKGNRNNNKGFQWLTELVFPKMFWELRSHILTISTMTSSFFWPNYLAHGTVSLHVPDRTPGASATHY